ncbi:MAG: M24 family metallopeptidase [Acidobacteriaceae bacterium]
MEANRFQAIGFRRDKLLAWMSDNRVDGVFFASPENVYYTTGYPCLPSSGNPIVYALRNLLPFFSFVNKDGKLTLLCWMMASFGAEYSVDDARTFFTYPMAVDTLTDFIKEAIQPGSVIAVESTCPYLLTKTLQENAEPSKVVFIDEQINRLRMIKSAEEIKRIQKSTEIIDRTVKELAGVLKLGMSRLELIDEAKWRLLRNGAHAVDHITVAFGPANPEIALGEILEPDQLVTLDLGGIYEGYASDNRKLAYTGRVPDDMRSLHEKLCDIVSQVGNGLQPGKRFSEIHALATSCYAQYDLDPYFLHAGHSIGLQVDEAWMLSDNETLIEENMVFNVELYGHHDSGVMIGNEETYLVTAHGAKKLSTLPPDIIEVA